MCVEPGKMCMNDMMAIDAQGGLGLAGARNTLPLAADAKGGRRAVFGPAPSYVASICTQRRSGRAEGKCRDGARRSAPLLRADIVGPHAAAPHQNSRQLALRSPEVATNAAQNHPSLHFHLRPADARGPAAPRADPGRHLHRRGAARRRRCSAAITYFQLWGYLWREWFTSVDHKRIGIMYMMLGIVMLLRGFSDAIMMRLQQAMAFGGSEGYLPPHHYDQIFTAHGVIMIFFVAMPLVTGLMNYRRAAADRRARRRLSRSSTISASG